MADFESFSEDIQKQLDEAISQLEKAAGSSQDEALNKIIELTKELELSNGNIKATAANFKIIGKIKDAINAAILNATYIDSVTAYVKAFNGIADAQDRFYKQIEGYKPSEFNKQVRQDAITRAINALTETGLEANVVNKVEDILKNSTATSARYVDVIKQLTEFMSNTNAGEGTLLRYVKTIAVDSINIFSAAYNEVITNNIGFDWFQYVGSLRETSREFCVKMVDMRYFHKSEIPDILKGRLPNGEKVELNGNTDLPNGMKAETNISNFRQLRGGWGCNHQIFGTLPESVPQNIRSRIN